MSYLFRFVKYVYNVLFITFFFNDFVMILYHFLQFFLNESRFLPKKRKKHTLFLYQRTFLTFLYKIIRLKNQYEIE